MKIANEDLDRWRNWRVLWKQFARYIRRRGGDVLGPVVKPPASEAEIADVEARLARPIPRAFRKVLLAFSGDVDFHWQLPDEREDEFAGLIEGGAYWALESIVSCEEIRREHAEYVRSCGGAGTELWAASLAWASSGEQDKLAFDVRRAGESPIVLLDRDGYLRDEEAWLAPDFEDFIDRWSQFGFAGGIRLIDEFIARSGKGLDPNHERAVAFRRALGFER